MYGWDDKVQMEQGWDEGKVLIHYRLNSNRTDTVQMENKVCGWYEPYNIEKNIHIHQWQGFCCGLLGQCTQEYTAYIHTLSIVLWGLGGVVLGQDFSVFLRAATGSHELMQDSDAALSLLIGGDLLSPIYLP